MSSTRKTIMFGGELSVFGEVHEYPKSNDESAKAEKTSSSLILGFIVLLIF
jgi:hypothetical protein